MCFHEKSVKVFLLVALRLTMGWMFLWAFLDKLFGWGFATAPENAWMAGGSPTYGFLTFGTHGPLATLYQTMAGHPVVDALFMAGLGLIGLALFLGVGVRIAGYSGALLMALMWSAGFPPENNPLIDEHVIYGLLFLGFGSGYSHAGQYFGLGAGWSKTPWVRRWPWLE